MQSVTAPLCPWMRPFALVHNTLGLVSRELRGEGWEPTNCPLCRQPRCTLQAGEAGALSAMRKLLAQALTLAAFSLAHGRIRLSACV